jgi:hypothetical protein
VTRRAPARHGEDQLRLDLDDGEHPWVAKARSVRRLAGLAESLTDPEVLANVWTILDVSRSSRCERSQASCTSRGTRRSTVEKQPKASR